MFCSKCGTQTPNDSQFCRKCGRTLSSATAVSSTGAAAAPALAPIPPTKDKRKVGIWFVLPLALLVLCWASASRNPGAQQLQRLAKQQHTENISDSTLAVNATGFSSFKLVVPPGASNVHLQGSFGANGGFGNDIEVYVLSEQDFINWDNGHASKTLYNSGKVTVGTLDVVLPDNAGTYYLVFSNKFSLLTRKGVRVIANLTYYE
jgi:hypothetical protein